MTWLDNFSSASLFYVAFILTAVISIRSAETSRRSLRCRGRCDCDDDDNDLATTRHVHGLEACPGRAAAAAPTIPHPTVAQPTMRVVSVRIPPKFSWRCPVLPYDL